MKWLDVGMGILSVVPALFPLVERQFALLPVNPGIRENVLIISIVLAAVVGLGGYLTTRRYGKPAIPWCSITAAVIAVVVMFALTGGMSFGMDPLLISALVASLYVVIFMLIGIAVGGFLGLI